MANIRGGTSRSIVRLSAIGTLVVATLVAGFGGWSAIASISGAVIASGTVVVESNIKRIQHSEGGIVGAIHVSNGDKVKAG
ncbi:MAG TPA: HlyD family type I secretion periplasmic adaptor subunit, partial [Thermohalobaculum sp.]|nr:HlyD family type I secretion periplasmic adaptor subunit [Thermohalobaculum sp.]